MELFLQNTIDKINLKHNPLIKKPLKFIIKNYSITIILFK